MFWISWVHQLVKGQAPLKLWSFLLLDFWLFISTLILNFILFILEVHSLSVGLIIRLSNFTETLPFNEFFFSHYHKFAITSYSSSKLVLFTSNFSKKIGSKLGVPKNLLFKRTFSAYCSYGRFLFWHTRKWTWTGRLHKAHKSTLERQTWGAL